MSTQTFSVCSSIYVIRCKILFQCFNCGVILKDWETTYNPWREHALFSSNCTFVLLNKGNEFKHRHVEHHFNQNT